jgi:hypothetical protein
MLSWPRDFKITHLNDSIGRYPESFKTNHLPYSHVRYVTDQTYDGLLHLHAVKTKVCPFPHMDYIHTH